MITPTSLALHAAARIRPALGLLVATAVAGTLLAACSSAPTQSVAQSTHAAPTLAQIMGEEPLEQPTDPWASNCYAGFEQDVLAVAGEEARDCGFLRIDAGKTQRAEVDRCLRVAAAGKKPFRAGHLDGDGKTIACDVAIRDGSGQLWRLWYDFDMGDRQSHGESDGVLIASRCDAMKFRAGSSLPGSFFAFEDCRQVPGGIAAIPHSPGHRLNP
jgi:hypothetical protein